MTKLAHHSCPTWPRPVAQHRPAAALAHRPSRLCAALGLALATGLSAQPAAAAELTWNGLFGSPFWSARFFGLSNWNGGQTPQSGDSLVFAGNNGLVNHNDYVGLQLSHLSFAAGAGAFTLQGLVPTQETRLTLTGDITNRSSQLQTINLAIDARGNQPQTWDGGTHGLAINGSAFFANDSVVVLTSRTRLNTGQQLQVGISGNSFLEVQNGSSVKSHGALLGDSFGSSGSIIFSDPGTTWENSGDLQVGKQGSGQLLIRQGAQVSNQNALIAGSPVGSVTVADAGSRWDNSGRLTVGSYAGGQTLHVLRGAAVSSRLLDVGSGGATALVDMWGAGSRLEVQQTLNIGANGVLNVTNGSTATSGQANIGDSTTSSGSVNVIYNGSSWQNAGLMQVGTSGLGQLTISNNGTVSTQTLELGTRGTLTLDGGTLQMEDASVTGAGQFNWVAGTVRYTKAAATLGAGTFLLDSSTTLAPHRTLEFSHSFAVGSGNQLLLAAGTLGGTGTLLNDGHLAGFGALAGSGGFTNSGALIQSGGNLVLSNSGANRNTGNWDLAQGKQLQLAGSTLSNHGTLALNGGTVSGSGTLVNAAGGVITGRGSINANFSNAGVLALEAGTTTIGQSFVNLGQVQLAANTAALAGALVNNSGTIEGRGRVGNAVNNTGTLEALGGTLTFAGTLTNTGAGVIAAGSGAKLVALQGLARNEGQIQLAGGTFDNNSKVLTNDRSGSVTGYGMLRSGTLVNEGRMLLASGPTAVYADLHAHSGSQVILSGHSNTAFYGTVDVQGGAEMRVSQGAVATYFGMVNQRSGALFSGTGNKYFEGGLALGNSPGLGLDAGNVTFGASNTYTAEVAGTHMGDAVGNGIQFDRYVVTGTLHFGGTLKLVTLDGFAPQAGQSFDLFDWGSSQGQFASLDFAQAPLAAGLAWDSSHLYVDGSLQVAAVPEPASWGLMLAGLGLLAQAARRPVENRSRGRT